AEVADLERQVREQPAAGTLPADELRKHARDARRQAQEAREAAAALRREAEALSAARDATQYDPGDRHAGQPLTGASPPPDPTLPGRQKEAAEKIGRNEVGQARQAQEAAGRMLRAVQDALQETAAPEGDRL